MPPIPPMPPMPPIPPGIPAGAASFSSGLSAIIASVVTNNPEIRIFNLYEPNPWRNTDLGISPDMSYAKEYCDFYKPYFIKE